MGEWTGSARLAEKLAGLTIGKGVKGCPPIGELESLERAGRVVRGGPYLVPPQVICIGTDRSTGDAFGPLTGMYLREAGYPSVFGTLDDPWDSETLVQRLAGLPREGFTLAVDCCVGSEVGKFRVQNRPLEPGKSMGKPLPPLGSAALLGIVAPNRGNPYSMLQTASLHLVMTMARQAADAIMRTYGKG